jgi:hypothetical protein
LGNPEKDIVPGIARENGRLATNGLEEKTSCQESLERKDFLPKIAWRKRLFARKCRSNNARAACSAGLCFVYSYTRQTALLA